MTCLVLHCCFRCHFLLREPQKFLGLDFRESHVFDIQFVTYLDSCSPMHAALGIVTCRMMIHLRKFTVQRLGGIDSGMPKSSRQPLETLHFASQGPGPRSALTALPGSVSV